MARPAKTGLDYFPLDTFMDDKVELLEAEHGLLGFAVMVKLLQKIYSEGYFYKWERREKLLFSKRNGVAIETLNSITASLLKEGIFNIKTYNKYHILTSAGIQKRYLEATKRRDFVDIDKRYSLINGKGRIDVNINGVNVNKNPVNDNNNPQGAGVYVNINSQSKVKESKVNKRKEKKRKKSALQTDPYFKLLIPDILKTPQFLVAWVNWIDYRKESKKPVSERAAKMQFKKLARHPAPEKVIEKSIENDWQGLFPERIKTNATAHTQTDIGSLTADAEQRYGRLFGTENN